MVRSWARISQSGCLFRRECIPAYGLTESSMREDSLRHSLHSDKIRRMNEFASRYSANTPVPPSFPVYISLLLCSFFSYRQHLPPFHSVRVRMSNPEEDYTAHSLCRKSLASTRASKRWLSAHRERFWKSKASAPDTPQFARSVYLRRESPGKTETDRRFHKQDGSRRREHYDAATKIDLRKKAAVDGTVPKRLARRADHAHHYAHFRERNPASKLSRSPDFWSKLGCG